MSVGSLRTLMNVLAVAPTLVALGASVVFGEERQVGMDQPLPLVCVMPQGGPVIAPGYYLGADPDVDALWTLSQSVDLYLWAASTTNGATQIDHAEAVEDLLAATLQAFQYQAPIGLKYAPVNVQWVKAQGEMERYGRACVLTVQVDVSIPGVQTVDATITTVTLTQTI